jgi:tetratricopeptide (TPR) repeat protein
MNINAHLNARPRTIILGVSAVILTWLVVSQSVTAFLADAAPQAALWIDSRQPEALVNLADRAVNTSDPVQASAGSSDLPLERPNDPADSSPQASGKTTKYPQNLADEFSSFESIGRNLIISRPVAPVNAPTVREWAITALKHDPLNARALRILGQLAEAGGDDAETLKFMQAADRLSLHDDFATYWLLRNSAQAGDYKSAIRYADILLRTDPPSNRYVVPLLAQISEDKTGATLIKAVLADNPPWRRQFFELLPNSVTDARVPLDLLLAVRTSQVPLTTDDINPYIYFLVAHRFYSLAYYTWLQFLPPDELRHVGMLFNGSFDAALSGLPFNWQITPGAGVTIDIVPRPDKAGKSALLVDFQYGRVDYHSVSELVMLTPGTYQFSGEYNGTLTGPRGMKWRVACADGKITSGGESPMINGVTKEWRAVTFTVTVPATGCVAQYVRLDLDARMASEQLISGTILFDDLLISRVANPSTSGG